MSADQVLKLDSRRSKSAFNEPVFDASALSHNVVITVRRETEYPHDYFDWKSAVTPVRSPSNAAGCRKSLKAPG
jgi:hypothetical protein